MNRQNSKTILSCLSLLILAASSQAWSYNGAFFLENDDEVFGETRSTTIEYDDKNLLDQAIEFNLGYNEIIDANPGIDPWNPGKGCPITIPTSWILPEIPKQFTGSDSGFILINLAEFRLFLVKRVGAMVSIITFPVGIGKKGFDTPVGEYTITEKLKDPSWTIPASFREEFPDLPDIVPPGPGNPLGKYALRLSEPGLLIHQTTNQLSVGRKVSHGCIRMTPEDIKDLYQMVHSGYDVIIVYQPLKIGVKDGVPYIEVHKDYLHNNDLLKEAITDLKNRNLLSKTDPELLSEAVKAQKGYPVKLVPDKKKDLYPFKEKEFLNP